MTRPKLVAVLAPVLVALSAAVAPTACSRPAPRPATPVSAGAEEPASAQAQAVRSASPLAGLAGRPVVVLPLHYIRADTLAMAKQIEHPRETLAALDSAIERALGDRGFRTSWTFPAALARSAKRNAGYVSDPYLLAGEQLRFGVRRTDNGLHEPLASQLRSITAFTDARFALFPVELRFEAAPSGGAQPVLRVVLLDSRSSQIRWTGEVRGTPGTTVTPAMLQSVAAALADLVAAP